MRDNFKVYGSFTTDYNAFIKNANIFDLSSDGNRDVSIGEDFIQFSVGIDLKLPWASVILGTNYLNGSSEFTSPLSLKKSGVVYNEYDTTQLVYSRWQFVVGLEIPVLENTFSK